MLAPSIVPKVQSWPQPSVNLLVANSQVMGSGLLSDNYAEGVKASVLDDCPLLTALIERVDNHPRVKEWNEAHDHQPLPKKRKT